MLLRLISSWLRIKVRTKVVFRLLDDVRRAAILGDGALVNDQHPVGKGEGLRVMGDNDGG